MESRLPPLSVICDRLISWMMWPVALVSLLLIPCAFFALLRLVLHVARQPLPIVVFVLGFVAYFVVWWNLLRKSRFTLFVTLEHELTHILFAAATFHRVTGIRVSMSRGGRMRFVGEGNWLILLAPYFFPTLTVLMMLLDAVLPFGGFGLGSLLIGASFAFHVTSTFREIHPDQSDIRRAGRFFSLAFLTAANLITVGVVVGFAHAGVSGAGRFLGDLWPNLP